MSFLNKTRRFIQPYAPNIVLAFGAWAKVAYKTRGLRLSEALKAQCSTRLPSGTDQILSLTSCEKSILSQNGEDGILEAIFTRIGFQSNRILELGFAATEANFLNLGFAHDLRAVFIDGSHDTCRLAAGMFTLMGRRHMSATNSFLTVENINQVIAGTGLEGEIDALSIDLDGNDYWIMEAIEVVNPRLIVIEYNDRLGPRASITVKYDASFDFSTSCHEFYQGASLLALTRLAQRRGYRLIGCDLSGTNAFFLRNDIVAPSIPTRQVGETFRYHKRSILSGYSESQRDQIIASLPFVHVA